MKHRHADPGRSVARRKPAGGSRLFKFCPDCGSATRPERYDGRARAACPACLRVWYANAKPCATALIEDAQGRVLLARRAIAPGLGLWNLPGGFLEEDESPDRGAVRETLEETGLLIETTALLGAYLDFWDGGSKPERAHVSLSLAYRARVVGGEFSPNPETSEIAWFAAEDLPPPAALAYDNHVQALADWVRLKGTQVLVNNR